MPRNLDPFRGKKTLGSANKAQRRGRKDRPKGSKNQSNSPWGLLGLAAGMAALWIFGALQIGGQKKEKGKRDKLLLSRLLGKPLKYTEHAICRMECRHISDRQILEALRNGSVNERKTNLRQFPCPKIVVDATVAQGLGSSSRKNMQAVFSACPAHTDVVTVIDKDTDWPCVCP